VDGLAHKIDVLLESLGNEKSIWEYYNEMAAVDDNIREVEWRDLADTVLIFVCVDTLYDVWLSIWFQDGLFAAFLSAFLVFLIPQLQPNSTDVAMDVLIHISQQLSNSTAPAFVPATFQVSPTANVVNTLFFLSLAFVLIDAFLAMLVKGWLQEFDRGWRKYTVARLRAQERERRLQELERWKLHEFVALLPILIQVSLLLFCIGLIVLIFPLHIPSAILSIFAVASVFGFYGFTTYVSIVNNYAPFSSPVSRLLARGLAALQTWPLSIARSALRIASAIRFHIRPPIPPHEQQTDAGTSEDAMPSNTGMAKPTQPYNPESIEKSKVAPRSRSDIDPQTYVHVLERLVSTTAEAVENIPVFLELLDQPVKDTTLRPLNVEKWKELFHITLGLLRDQPTFPVSTARTLARTMMICYNRETADQQLGRALQYHLGSKEADKEGSRMPFNLLFSSYLSIWLSYSPLYDLCRTIAFLEPSGAADAELFWMVNTVHMAMQSEDLLSEYFVFCVAVLTYVSSTEQCRRSQIPLTAAVIYALHTMRSALDQGGTAIEARYILPGTVSASGSATLMTFCHVDGVDALDLWSEECIQFIQDLLQGSWEPYWYHDFQLSLIAALYIDSTKQAHVRHTFADLLKYTSITDTEFQFSGAYDGGKLAVYWYMVISQRPLDQDRYPLATIYDVIRDLIRDLTIERSTSLSRLHILDIAVTCVHKAASPPSAWLQRQSSGLEINPPGDKRESIFGHGVLIFDRWVLLHLDTLLAPHPYLLPEDVEELQWSDTPEKVYIAKARLDLYDSLANEAHEGPERPKPDPGLLRLFLWSKDFDICTRAFKWCLDLVPIGLPGPLGDADGTRMFIPETMGSQWVEHFLHVLCKDNTFETATSLVFLISHLVPKWTKLPSSWCRDFASALFFFIIYSQGTHKILAYQYLGAAGIVLIFNEMETFLSFLGTLLGLIKSSLTWARLASFEHWLADLDVKQGVRTQMARILTTVRQQLMEETLGFFAELPMAGPCMDE
jgi:hypothetical protein